MANRSKRKWLIYSHNVAKKRGNIRKWLTEAEKKSQVIAKPKKIIRQDKDKARKI